MSLQEETKEIGDLSSIRELPSLNNLAKKFRDAEGYIYRQKGDPYIAKKTKKTSIYYLVSNATP